MIIVYFQFQLSDVEEHADEASLSPLKTHFLWLKVLVTAVVCCRNEQFWQILQHHDDEVNGISTVP